MSATGPSGPTDGNSTGAGAPTAGGPTNVTGGPPLISGSSGPGTPPPVTPDNPKPSLISITVALASHPPGLIPDPPNVINHAAVKVANEASMTVTGQNFVNGSRVRINERDLLTDVVSPTIISARLTAANVSKPGEYRVTVFTPTPGGGTSNAMKLYVEPEPKWGLLEKALVLGMLGAAALWIFWIITAWDRSVTTEPARWQLTWLVMFVILAVFTFGVGRALTGTWKSLLIDERNMQSLSRLQLMLWTWLVISAIATAAAWNIHIDADDPLGIHVPEELWILLGISAATLVGSNLIKTQQAATPDITPQQTTGTTLMDSTGGQQMATGTLAQNVSRVQARWTDMFKSEGVHNAHTLDVGKIQMFFFTLIVVLAYVAAFARTSYTPSVDNVPAKFDFPPLGESLVALLGISSTAYLANKAAKQL
jgi:hypothetical protein